MKRRAVYPGSFDPVTNGHVDIIERAIGIFDELVVGVAKHTPKKTTFSVEERVELLEHACAGYPGVSVESFDNLLVDWTASKGFAVIVRGLRALSDFEYEFQMALANRKLRPDIETVFLMTREDCSCISSSMIREIVFLGGSVDALVPAHVVQALAEKIKKARE